MPDCQNPLSRASHYQAKPNQAVSSMENPTFHQNTFAQLNLHHAQKTVTVQFDGFLGRSRKPVVWTISLTLDEAIQFADRNGDIAAEPILQKVLEVTK